MRLAKDISTKTKHGIIVYKARHIFNREDWSMELYRDVTFDPKSCSKKSITLIIEV